MTGQERKRAFAARPTDPETWVRARDAGGKANPYTARLTVDVTPDLRGRIKIAAFRRGVTVADMLRDLLAREYPDDAGEDT